MSCIANDDEDDDELDDFMDGAESDYDADSKIEFDEADLQDLDEDFGEDAMDHTDD